MTHAEPAQRPSEPSAALVWATTPAALCEAVLRPLAGRAAILLATAAHHLGRYAADAPDTARERALAAGHPCTRPRLAVVPSGIAQGRADLQFTHHQEP